MMQQSHCLEKYRATTAVWAVRVSEENITRDGRKGRLQIRRSADYRWTAKSYCRNGISVLVERMGKVG